jgi:hypothetical protein
MAFKTQNNYGKTIFLGSDPKKDQQEVFTGYPVDVKRVETGEGKKKKDYTFILCVEADKCDAEQVSLCSCAAINNVLLTKDGELKPAFRGKLCRFTYNGHKKVEGYPQPLKQIKVEMDDSETLKKYELPPL